MRRETRSHSSQQGDAELDAPPLDGPEAAHIGHGEATDRAEDAIKWPCERLSHSPRGQQIRTKVKIGRTRSRWPRSAVARVRHTADLACRDCRNKCRRSRLAAITRSRPSTVGQDLTHTY